MPSPTPAPTPPPERISAWDVYLAGEGVSFRREFEVGKGTLRARFEGKGSQVQVFVREPSGNVAVDTAYPDGCSLSVKAEASVEATGGPYEVVVKVDPRRRSACCTQPACLCKIPSCFFANGQLTIAYPAP